MRIFIALTAAAAIAGTGAFVAPANAAKTKTCASYETIVGPGNSGMTQTTTETQTSACNSNSDTGFQSNTGPVTNRGGGTPPGQQ